MLNTMGILSVFFAAVSFLTAVADGFICKNPNIVVQDQKKPRFVVAGLPGSSSGGLGNFLGKGFLPIYDIPVVCMF